MTAGTYVVTHEYECKILDLIKDFIEHGYGEIHIEINELKTEFKVRVLYKAGKSWVYFIDKNYNMRGEYL